MLGSALTVLALLAAFLIAQPILAIWGKDDTEGQPLLHGTGRVESVYYPRLGRNGGRPTFVIRIKDQTVHFPCLLNLQRGQTVNIDYRVGKSGTIFIDHIID